MFKKLILTSSVRVRIHSDCVSFPRCHCALKAAILSGLKLILFALTLSAIALLAGCRTMKSEKVSAEMIQARELTYSGIHAEQDGHLGRAENIFSRAVAMSPDDETARTRYAEALARRGSLDDAIKQMAEAHRISHGDPNISIRIGELHLRKGDLSQAMFSADSALGVNRKLAEAWALKGRVHAASDQTQQALENYLRALTCRPEFPEVRMEVARCYMLLGRHQRALSNLNIIAATYASGSEPQELLLLQSDAFTGMNRMHDSLEILAALAVRPEATAEIWFRYGQALAESGDTVNARLVLQNARGRYPEDPRIDASLARLNSIALPVSLNR